MNRAWWVASFSDVKEGEVQTHRYPGFRGSPMWKTVHGKHSHKGKHKRGSTENLERLAWGEGWGDNI